MADDSSASHGFISLCAKWLQKKESEERGMSRGCEHLVPTIQPYMQNKNKIKYSIAARAGRDLFSYDFVHGLFCTKINSVLKFV